VIVLLGAALYLVLGAVLGVLGEVLYASVTWGEALPIFLAHLGGLQGATAVVLCVAAALGLWLYGEACAVPSPVRVRRDRRPSGRHEPVKV
jgi:hypothetical protein